MTVILRAGAVEVVEEVEVVRCLFDLLDFDIDF